MAAQLTPFNPYMLQLARAARGCTQEELAKRARISQAKLSKAEHGLLPLSQTDISAIAEALDYPIEFFHELVVPAGFPPYHHRKRKSLSAKILDIVHAAMNIRRLHVEKLVQSTEIHAPKQLPRYDVDEIGDACRAARIVREHLGLPRGPVPNVVEAIEGAGVLVIVCDFNTTKLDALSQCDERLPPMIFINSNIPGDRARFTLAHELGHIVLHSVRPSLDDDEMERQADSFAAEFLMPEDDIKPQLLNLSLPKLARLKEIWKVSMQAILMRAQSLKTITRTEYERLWKQISRAGYRVREPIEIPREEPRAVKMLINIHLKDLNYSVGELARMLRLKIDEFSSTYLGTEARLRLVT